MKPTLGIATLVLLAAGIAASSNASAQTYTYTDLNTVPASRGSNGSAVNNSGQ
jgi:hypothetical protein